MAPTSKLSATKSQTQKAVKEKVLHPQSRKAAQLERAALRKGKLAAQSSARSKQQIAKVDRIGFFYLALPPGVSSLNLEEFHELVSSLWIPRHDEAIKAEEATRRKGRPPSAREGALREQKRRDIEEYRTGLELPDLTHGPSVELFRGWDGADISYLHLLRFVRISSANPKLLQTVRHGLNEQQLKNPLGAESGIIVKPEAASLDAPAEQQTWLGGFPDVPLSKFSSTMQTMDNV